MNTKTFTDVAGQTITIQRPPDGYLVVADTDATHFFVSKEILRSAPDAADIVLQRFQEATLQRKENP